MEYKYAENRDYSFLASGNVLKHFSGMPCFPVRLGIELFERAYRRIGREKITVYDPCCGSGYSLAVLGMTEQDKIRALYASDVDGDCLEAAECNLSMTSPEGLRASAEKLLRGGTLTGARRDQLTESADRILPYLFAPPDYTVFRHDILLSAPEIGEPVDYVFADVPYGMLTDWKSDGGVTDPLRAFAENTADVLSDGGVLVVCGMKDLRIGSEKLKRIGRFSVGKRLALMFEKAGPS